MNIEQAPPYIILRRTPECLTAYNMCGEYNGYVSLPPDHPWHGVHYEDIPMDIHGDLTYSIMEAERWVIGFDTCHFGDTAQRWPVEAVAAEAESLLKQAEAVYKP